MPRPAMMITWIACLTIQLGCHPPSDNPAAADLSTDEPVQLSLPSATADTATTPLLSTAEAATAQTTAAPDSPTTSTSQFLFDGESLAGWKATRFGGEGEVYVEGAAIHLGFGNPMTGITIDTDHAWGKSLKKNNFEVSVEAQRVDGGDFFCALTFPVDDSHCTFVVGGWGGSVVGISSIDGIDAVDNATTQYMPFKKGQWYLIRVRVTPDLIEAWIDDKRMVHQELADKKLSTRIEVDLNRPLGIASFATHAALRNITLTPIEAP